MSKVYLLRNEARSMKDSIKLKIYFDFYKLKIHFFKLNAFYCLFIKVTIYHKVAK